MLPSLPAINDELLYQLACEIKQSSYQFTTVTPATHERINSRPENQWSRNLEDVFGWSRPFKAEVLPSNLLNLMREADIVVANGEGWRSLVRFSTLNGLLFVHSAYPTDDADAVFFGPDTYRFSTAIQQHVASHSQVIQRAVDIGCGAGPGAIFVARSYPDAQVYGVDINDIALRFSRINSKLSKVSNLELRNSNLLSDVEGCFDLIVANPPYLIDPSERAYRHGGGLLGAGLSLAIVEAALERLNQAGTLLLYTGSAVVNGEDQFRAAIQKQLADTEVKWTYREMDPDIFGEELLTPAYSHTDRIAAVVLTVTKL